MIAAVCLDDRNGTLFNGRRQSTDREVQKMLMDLSGNRPLWVSPYTAEQFSKEDQNRLAVSSRFLQEAVPGDLCFVEDQSLLPVEDRLEQLMLIRWNRRYLADSTLDLPLEGWRKTTSWYFAGHSHNVLTMEVYERWKGGKR